MQLDQLWEYTQIDMAAERFETEMKKAPNRLKLRKLRDALVEQQNKMKRVEGDIAAMNEKIEAGKASIEKLNDSLRDLLQEVADAQEDSVAELEGLIEEGERLLSIINKTEQDLTKMSKDVDLYDRQQKSIRQSAGENKAEYDRLKAIYDVEFKKDSEKLKQLKENTEKAAAKLPPELLEKYKTVRQHTVPPVARLINGQCSGCNMSLPSAVMRRIAADEEIVECDNCGAILYAPAENA